MRKGKLSLVSQPPKISLVVVYVSACRRHPLDRQPNSVETIGTGDRVTVSLRVPLHFPPSNLEGSISGSWNSGSWFLDWETQRALNHFFSLKKSPENGGGQNITPRGLGTFGVKKACFGRVFKMTADLSLPIVDFFPFSFPFNHIIFSIALYWKCLKKELLSVNLQSISLMII